MAESILKQSVRNVIEALEGVDADFQALLEEERAGKNRKSLVKWLEKQDAQSCAPTPGEEVSEGEEAVDASVPEVEPVYAAPEPVLAGPDQATRDYIARGQAIVAGIDSIEGGEMAISELIDALCQKRDSFQRSASCGLENIRVHLAEIKITIR